VQDNLNVHRLRAFYPCVLADEAGALAQSVGDGQKRPIVADRRHLH
jgi:hypothetical protein